MFACIFDYVCLLQFKDDIINENLSIILGIHRSFTTSISLALSDVSILHRPVFPIQVSMWIYFYRCSISPVRRQFGFRFQTESLALNSSSSLPVVFALSVLRKHVLTKISRPRIAKTSRRHLPFLNTPAASKTRWASSLGQGCCVLPRLPLLHQKHPPKRWPTPADLPICSAVPIFYLKKVACFSIN